MRILFLGEFAANGRSKRIADALEHQGHRVVRVHATVLDGSGETVNDRRLSARVAAKLGFPLDPAACNRALLEVVATDAFDLLWVNKTLPLRPWTLARVRREQPRLRTMFYSEDDMFAAHNRSWYFVGCLPHYDVVFTTKSYNADPHELPALGARSVAFVDKSYDEVKHRPVPVTDEERARFGARVGFIGTFEEERAALMFRVAEAGIDVRIWGNDWPESWRERHPRLHVEGKPVLGEDYIKTICATDINLGFLRKANRDLQTDRTMEIPACGGFMLAERSHEHQRLFREGEEAEFFSTADELIEKCRRYLERPDLIRSVAAAGRRRCESSQYSFQARLPMMLAIARGESAGVPRSSNGK